MHGDLLNMETYCKASPETLRSFRYREIDMYRVQVISQLFASDVITSNQTNIDLSAFQFVNRHHLMAKCLSLVLHLCEDLLRNDTQRPNTCLWAMIRKLTGSPSLTIYYADYVQTSNFGLHCSPFSSHFGMFSWE